MIKFTGLQHFDNLIRFTKLNLNVFDLKELFIMYAGKRYSRGRSIIKRFFFPSSKSRIYIFSWLFNPELGTRNPELFLTDPGHHAAKLCSHFL